MLHLKQVHFTYKLYLKVDLKQNERSVKDNQTLQKAHNMNEKIELERTENLQKIEVKVKKVHNKARSVAQSLFLFLMLADVWGDVGQGVKVCSHSTVELGLAS